MTEENYNFLCHKYKPSSDGTVNYYILEVTNRASGAIEVINVKPEELASSKAMKRILLGRKIFYSATNNKHNEMLKKIFDSPPRAI